MDKDKIYVSPLNFLDAVTAGENFAENIELVEITLREEVVYDRNLTVEQKATLAVALDELGIPVLQLHAQGAGEVIRACRARGVRAEFDVLCRPYNPYGFASWQDEVRAVVDSGADRVHISTTTPRKWMMGEPGMSRDAIQARALEAIQLAADLGAPRVVFGITDAPRTDLDFLLDTCEQAAKLGVFQIVLNDTVGVVKPATVQYMVRRVKDLTGTRVEVHCHNDFGLAAANTLAALQAGADSADVVVNGADPARSGIASLAEIVMALLCLYRQDLGYNTEKLLGIARMFSDYSGMPIDEQEPVVADRNWMYKRDHIMRTITLDESIQFPYSPSLVGQRFQIGLGRGSGPVAVRAKLDEMNLSVPDELVPDLARTVTQAAVERGRRLTDEEFLELVESQTRTEPSGAV